MSPRAIDVRLRSALYRMIRNPIHAPASCWRVTGSIDRPVFLAVSVMSTSSFSNESCWPSVDAPRSNASVPIATFQPPFTSPSTSSTAVRAPSKNTSLNSDVPVNWTMGRISIPGWRIGTSRYEIPRCRGASRSVRQSTKHQSAQCASDVQIF